MGMAFDSRRGRTVVFGGSTGFNSLVPPWTWEWDGVIWRVVATNGPSRRTECAMAYDAKRHVTLLFGGRDESYIPKRDTWSWDGTNWTAVSVAGPVARQNHGMVYDSVRERVLLYGGVGEEFTVGTNGLGDLWEWDGSRWLFSSTNGPRHYNPAMAFDSQRGEAVVWGGSRDFVDLRETWLLKLHETWVDFSYMGTETGTFASPFNTLTEAVSATPSGSAVKIKAGASAENLTIAKRMSVQAFGGPVTIGQ
jgi:hypothetical protein